MIINNQNMTTYIIGHQKPDTDSVVATLAFKHIFDSQECWGHPNSKACITHPLNPETAFLFNKFPTSVPEVISAQDITHQDKVVLVDHNEESQRLENLNPELISDIFDHHKLSLNLTQPIFATIKAWGSTCTIAWHIMNLHKIDIPENLAALMLSAIISDTVNLKSPTSTKIDKNAIQDLAKKANIKDTEKLALEIFKAKSNTKDLSDVELLKNDYKVFTFNNKQVFIGQAETVEQSHILANRGEGLKKAMLETKNELKLDHVFLAVTDILNVNTKLITIENATEVGERAFKTKAVNGILDIGPKLSRKKEIAPAIENILKND